MPAYNFKAEFADDVESGAKRQTIRRRRKRPTKVGDPLFLYTGMRTKRCRLLRRQTETCVAVLPIDLLGGPGQPQVVRMYGRFLSDEETLELAQADGFETVEAFFGFFDELYGLPLVHQLEVIKW